MSPTKTEIDLVDEAERNAATFRPGKVCARLSFRPGQVWRQAVVQMSM